MKSLMRKIVLEYDNKYENTMKKHHHDKVEIEMESDREQTAKRGRFKKISLLSDRMV